MADNNNGIDFVVLWVNGNDQKWQEARSRYLSQRPFRNSLEREKVVGKRRYRDWGLFRYFFRSIETYAPWFRKIHVITSDQHPDWLNLKEPRLNLVSDRDIFKDPSCLPTFNSNAIQMNIANIAGLSDLFILTDDDFFIIKRTDKTRFFENGLPKDYISYKSVDKASADDPAWVAMLKNNISLIEKHFKANLLKLPLVNSGYDIRLNLINVRNFLLTPFMREQHFSPFGLHHFHQPLCKKNIIETISTFKEEVDEVVKHRFRQPNDLTHFIFRYWHLATGQFIPYHKNNEGAVISLRYYRGIVKQFEEMISDETRFLCLNDDVPDSTSPEDERKIQNYLVEQMEKIFPVKSSFEI